MSVISLFSRRPNRDRVERADHATGPSKPQYPTVSTEALKTSHALRLAAAREEWGPKVAELEVALSESLREMGVWRPTNLIVDSTGTALGQYQIVAEETSMRLVVVGDEALPENVMALINKADRSIREFTSSITKTATDYAWHGRYDKQAGIFRNLADRFDISLLNAIAAEAERDFGNQVVFRGATYVGALAFPSNNEPVTYFATNSPLAASHAGGLGGWLGLYRVSQPERIIDLRLALNTAVAAELERMKNQYPDLRPTINMVNVPYYRVEFQASDRDALGSEAQAQAAFLRKWVEAAHKRPTEEITLAELARTLAYPGRAATAFLESSGLDGAWLPDGELVITNSAFQKMIPVLRPSSFRAGDPCE